MRIIGHFNVLHVVFPATAYVMGYLRGRFGGKRDAR